jgi:comEA protein
MPIMKLWQRPIPLTFRIALGFLCLGFAILGSIFYILESRTITKEYNNSQATTESLLNKVKEANASTTNPSAATSGEHATHTSAVVPNGIIKLSTATQAELETLPGIGPVKANAIVDYRNSKGLKSVNDLQKVNGIGPKTVEKLKPLVEL